MDFALGVCLTRYNTLVQRWSRGHKARGQGQGHKKIRGQGQGHPFRGQTLSKPRTGMLEAKAKDQGQYQYQFIHVPVHASKKGHKRKSSPKKKGLQKFFRRFTKKKRS